MYFAASTIAFAMAWAIGAQDVSNALGTSVGAKAVTVRQAIYIAGVCEFLGSLAGGEVAGMISGGILSVDRFVELGDEGVRLYAVVMMSTMSGAFIWLAVATYFSLPVSTTHSLVGALVGVGTVTLGPQAINFTVITAIVTSWATSPLLGGAISFIGKRIHKHVFIILQTKSMFFFSYQPVSHKACFILGACKTHFLFISSPFFLFFLFLLHVVLCIASFLIHHF